MPTSRIPFLDLWIPEFIANQGETLRKARLLVVSCYGVITACLFYTIMYFILSHVAGAVVCIYGGLSAVALLFYFRKAGNFIIGGNFFAFTSAVVMGAFAITTSGLNTIIGAWIVMVPMSGFLLANRKSGVFWTFISLLLAGGIYAADLMGWVDKSVYYGDYAEIVNLCALLGLITFVTVVIRSYEIGKERVQIQLEKANAEVRELNSELEKKVDERTQSLIRANEELDTFLYESSHALRRPLASIIGFSDLLQADLTQAEKAGLLDKINMKSHQMDKLLGSLVQVSELNNREQQFSRFLLSSLVERVAAKFGDRLALSTDLQDGMEIETDPLMLEQLLVHLIENAVDFRKESQEKALVKLSARVAEGKLRFSLQDEGMGISPELREVVMKMFVRGTNRSTGNGLGLYIVSRIISHLNGKINLTDGPSGGTEVIVEIPLRESKKNPGL